MIRNVFCTLNCLSYHGNYMEGALNFYFYFKIGLPFLSLWQSAPAPEQHFFHASSNFNHSPKWSLPLIEHTQVSPQFVTIKVGVVELLWFTF